MYKISEDQLKAILTYLGTKPYAEVFIGIQILQNLEKLEGYEPVPEIQEEEKQVE
jgi:hypothetical protein